MTRLGQHFLIHEPTLSKIAKSLRALPRERIIEIGGGHGELTAHLARQFRANIITVIEKDPKLVQFLIKKFQGFQNVRVESGDALEILPKISRAGNNFRVIANLPYYLTGHFLRIVGETRSLPKSLVLLIQKEVAERIAAEPPRMNRLSASVQIWGSSKIIFRVPRSSFRPSPKVEGAVVEITPHFKKQTNLDVYYKAVRILFAQPRKTIFNNLNSFIKSKAESLRVLSEAGIDPNSRPQNLTISQIVEISKGTAVSKSWELVVSLEVIGRQ